MMLLFSGNWQLRCLQCDQFAVHSEDLRKVKDSHHVVVDESITARVKVFPHPRPVQYDDFVKSGKLYCGQCNYDWGILATYKLVPFAVLKIVSFVLVDSYDRRDTKKKWKDAPFSVVPIAQSDLERQFTWSMHSEQEDSD